MVKFLKTTMIGGIVFMVPIIIFIAIIGKAIKLTHKLAAPVSALIPVDAKSTLARKSLSNLESRVFSKIPVYGFVKSKVDAIVQPEKAEGMKPVLAKFDDYWQIAFEVERIPGETVAIFLPGAPDPWSGSVCYVTEDRIQPLELTLLPVLKTLKGLGKGSNEQLRAYLKKGL